MDVMHDLSWQDHAACRGIGLAIFFPDVERKNSVEYRRQRERAQAMCAQCPVQQHCTVYADGHNVEHGIYGGETASARKVRRKRENRARIELLEEVA